MSISGTASAGSLRGTVHEALACVRLKLPRAQVAPEMRVSKWFGSTRCSSLNISKGQDEGQQIPRTGEENEQPVYGTHQPNARFVRTATITRCGIGFPHRARANPFPGRMVL